MEADSSWNTVILQMNEVTLRSEITELVNVMEGYENVGKESLEEWLQNCLCELDFQYMKF
jgi:hypothetical protein